MQGWTLGLAGMVVAACVVAPADAAVFYPTSFTLGNGLQVVVVPNHLAPVVNQMVWYKVGSSDEKPGKTGLAHYLEHLMFRGTSNIPPEEFSKMIAAQGGNDNAFTSYDYTAYFETVAADRLPMIMQMEADRMHNLQIKAETATPELSVVLNERQERTDNNPEGRFSEKLRQSLMPGHAYGRPVIGWKKEIETLSVDDANHFYQSHYAPNNAVVVISGDVETDQVMKLAASIYGGLPRQNVPQRQALPAMPRPKTHRLAAVDAGVDQPQMTWQVVVPSYATQKGNQAYAYEILDEILDDGEVGILYRKLVNERKLASGVAANYDPDARGESLFTIALSPRNPKDTAKLEQVFHDVLQDIAKDGVTDKMVSDAKQRLQRSAIFARDSLMMPGYAFGMAVATGHTVADVEAWPDHIKAVTVDEVNQALHDLVTEQRSIMGILLPDHRPGVVHPEAPVIHHDMGIR